MSKSKSSESVKVVVRCRPMNEKERAANFERVVSVDVKFGQVAVRNTRGASSHEHPKVFTFDSVYDWNSKQMELYDETFRPLVDSVLLGFNGTIFAYGQTGTGKTFTMEGVRNDPERRGVIPNSFEHIFTHISRSQNQQYLVRASYLEIYQEEIKDLLSKDQSRRLELKERPDTGVYVKDLSSFVTKSVREIEHVMNVGNQNRSVGATNMNEHSSRSHAIFVITVECSELGPDGENHIRVGKLNLVDLAGSERQTKTGAQGERLKKPPKSTSLCQLWATSSQRWWMGEAPTSHTVTLNLQDCFRIPWAEMPVRLWWPTLDLLPTIWRRRWPRYAMQIAPKTSRTNPASTKTPRMPCFGSFRRRLPAWKNNWRKGLARRGEKEEKEGWRRRRGVEDEEDDDEEEEEDDDEEEGVDADKNITDYWREQQEKLEKERKAIMEDHSLVAGEKQRLLKEKERKMDDLRKEKEASEMLTAKVKVRKYRSQDKIYYCSKVWGQ